MTRFATLLGALVLAFASLAGAALAQAPRASLTDIEDEVMCPVCGTALNVAEAPQAERQRDFIRAEIARGRTKDEIKTALVAEYGSDVLAEPSGSEVGWLAWAVPLGALLAALGVLALAVPRWRARSARTAGTFAGTPSARAPSDAELRRLDAELDG